MLKGLIFIILTGLLSNSFSTTNLDSVAVAPVEIAQPMKTDTSNHINNTIRKFSDKKTARKHTKTLRKDFRKDHPKPFGQFLIEYVVPPLMTAILTFLQCKK